MLNLPTYDGTLAPFASTVEHAHRADGGTFHDGEAERRFQREGAMHADGDDATGVTG